MTSLKYIIFSSTDLAVSVSAGTSHTCALFSTLTGGRIRCWGYGRHGRLGYDSSASVGLTLTDMSTLGYISFSDTLSAVHVTAGAIHTCAVFTGRRLRCWGDSQYLGYESSIFYGESGGVSSISLAPYVKLSFLSPTSPSLADGSSASPAVGDVGGGRSITISGTEMFTNQPIGAPVSFRFTASSGPCAATPIYVVGKWTPISMTTGSLVVPPWTCPLGPVSIAAAWDGFNFDSSAVSLTFANIDIQAVSPSSGSIEWNELITLTGSAFPSSFVTVRFATSSGACSTTPVEVTSWTAPSSTSATIQAPVWPCPPATATIFTSHNGGSYIGGTQTYTFAALDVQAVSPSSGGVAGDELITLTGLYFPTSLVVVRFTAPSGACFTTPIDVTTGWNASNSTHATIRTPLWSCAGAIASISVSFNGGSFTGAVSFTFLDMMVQALNPASGIVSGNELITLSGLFFPPSFVTVRFTAPGGACFTTPIDVTSGWTLTSPTSATIRTPLWPCIGAPATISTSFNGGAFLNRYVTFAFLDLILQSVSPTSGSVGGNELITLTGLHFPSTLVVVHFAAPGDVCDTRVNVTGWTTSGSTAATIRTPLWPCPIGTVYITPSFGNVSYGSVPFSFYPSNAAITSFAPRGWPIGSSTTLLLTGSNLQATSLTTCKFGSSVITPMTVTSTTAATCPSPVVGSGQDLMLTFALNNVTFIATNLAFSAFSVTVGSIDVPNGPATGGTPLSLRLTPAGGTLNFPGHVILVRFVHASNSPFVAPNSTLIIAAASAPSISTTTPSIASASPAISLPAPLIIEVSFNGGTSTAATSSFEYYSDPAINLVQPVAVPADNSAGTVITISGSNLRSYFNTFCRVVLNGTVVIDLVGSFSGSSTSGVITATLPALAIIGPATVEVSLNNKRQFTTNKQTFAIFAVTALTPAGGPLASGTIVTVLGSGFVPSTSSCRFTIAGSSPLVTTATSTSSGVTCATPATTSPGTYTVEVSLDTVRFSASSLRFLYYSVPTFSALDPSTVTGSNVTGVVTTVTGANFPSVPSVQALCRFGGATATSALSSSPTTLVCPVPATSAGSLALSVAFNGVDYHSTGLSFAFAGTNLVCGAGSIPDVTLTSCVACPPGSFAGAGSTSCTPCPSGQYASANASSSCTICPLGRFARVAGSSTCTPCPRGTYSFINGSTSCPQCSSAEYSDIEEATSCSQCPAGTFSSGTPSSLESCACKPGFFESSLRAGVACAACPAGGVCPGGNGTASRPYSLPGFWASALAPTSFIRCEPPESCPGGVDSIGSCAVGYTGRMCSQCVEGWFRSGGECRPCPRGSIAIMVGFVLFSFAVALLLVKFGARKSAKAYGGTIGIATKFFQVLAVIGKLDVRWPFRVKRSIATVSEFSTLRFDALGPECSAVSVRYEHKWAFTMLLPVFFAAIFAVVYIAAWVACAMRRKKVSSSFRNRIVNGYLSLLSLGFLTLASTSLELFGCRLEKDDKWTLVADPSRLCFERWWTNLVPFAAAGIVIYIFCIPLALFWWLRRNRDRLTDPQFVERYGGLYSTYVPGLPHWEPVVMVEKVAIAAVGLLLNGFVMLQIMLLQSIFVATLPLYQKYQPFARPRDNLLHTMLRWCSLLVLAAGIIFRADQFPSTATQQGVEVFALALIAGSTVTVVGAVVVNLWLIRRSLKTTLSKDLEAAMEAVTSTYGRLVLTTWLTDHQGEWNDKLQAVLSPLQKLAGSLQARGSPRPVSGELTPCGPREAWVEVGPEAVFEDPLADMVLTVFTSGVLRDDIAPLARAWLTTLDSSLTSAPSTFSSCFASVGRRIDAGQVRVALTRFKSRIDSPFADPGGAVRLFSSLYGHTPPSPHLLGDPDYLMAVHNVFVITTAADLALRSPAPQQPLLGPLSPKRTPRKAGIGESEEASQDARGLHIPSPQSEGGTPCCEENISGEREKKGLEGELSPIANALEDGLELVVVEEPVGWSY